MSEIVTFEMLERCIERLHASGFTAEKLKSRLQRYMQQRRNCHTQNDMIVGLLEGFITEEHNIEDVIPDFIDSPEGECYSKEDVVEALTEVKSIKYKLEHCHCMNEDELLYIRYLGYLDLWVRYVPPMRAANKRG